ncbi:MAG: DUF4270 domain-containing protein [Bacteroides sp.]|nr:DUF4270 domain-containing protein [Barnesiella sp.]MBD5314931.1 DUF4270 domain-containing protein [Bacteroides sp.]MDE7450104.1 DUF4270 domain-containing protein [Paramuribaculum sp.]
MKYNKISPSVLSLRTVGMAIAGTVAGISALTSCDDTVSTVGSSLTDDEVSVIIDSAFTVSGRSVDNMSVMSRTTMQLLGRIEAQGYGSFTSDIVTQFMPTAAIDTTGVKVENIDSIKLVMFINVGDFTGDSLVPMGLKVYRLNRQLPSPIFSNFDPAGYYSKGELLGETVYSANALQSDSLNKLEYRSIEVKLPVEFGRDLYRRYLSDPSTFATPQAFANWFPGVYISNSFGSGRVVNISESRVNVYYRANDTVRYGRSYMAVTPEVITNNNISYSMDAELRTLVSREPVIVAPAGTDVSVDFPTDEILSRFRSQGGDFAVLNDLTFTVPAEKVANKLGINPPDFLLMVLAKDKESFFAENEVSQNSGTNYYAAYDTLNCQYSFTGLRSYLLEMLEKETVTAEDRTFTITPINVTTETTSNGYYGSTTTISGMEPYVTAPAMVKLNLDSAKIKLVFSRQNIKF